MHLRSCLIIWIKKTEYYHRSLTFYQKTGLQWNKTFTPSIHPISYINGCQKLVHLERVWNVFDPHGEKGMSKLFIQAHTVEYSGLFFTLWLENGKTWETNNFPPFIHVLSDNGTSANVWNKQNSRILQRVVILRLQCQ